MWPEHSEQEENALQILLTFQREETQRASRTVSDEAASTDVALNQGGRRARKARWRRCWRHLFIISRLSCCDVSWQSVASCWASALGGDPELNVQHGGSNASCCWGAAMSRGPRASGCWGSLCRMINVLFTWLISRTFSVNEQYFSLTTNQSTVFSAMSYLRSEQGNHRS